VQRHSAAAQLAVELAVMCSMFVWTYELTCQSPCASVCLLVLLAGVADHDAAAVVRGSGQQQSDGEAGGAHSTDGGGALRVAQRGRMLAQTLRVRLTYRAITINVVELWNPPCASDRFRAVRQPVPPLVRAWAFASLASLLFPVPACPCAAPACPSSWKSGKLSSDWFSHQKQVRESVGITADEDAKKPVVTPEGLVQCCAAFCDEVPQEQAHALNCGHAFCDESVTTRARRGRRRQEAVRAAVDDRCACFVRWLRHREAELTAIELRG
jgi:hypothetical protein